MNIDLHKITTPCYILDEKLFRRNLREIKRVKDLAEIDIILAFKGFAMWKTFPILRQFIKKAAVSSVNEAQLAFEELGTYAHTYCPVYDAKNFDKILSYSSHITFNSLTQLKQFLPQIKQYQRKISVGIRINPEYSEIETELYNPASPTSRLGVPPSHLANKLPEGVEGLHFHALCESDSYTLEKILKVVEEKFAPLIKQARWINMGGGHLITHKNYNTQHIIDLLKRFKEKYQVEVILEPGSAFAWQTGYLVASVLDIVKNGGLKTAMLDISFTAHAPDCLEMPYKPQIIGATNQTEGKPTYRMGGNSCLAGDFIGNWSFENELKVGDKIVFDDMIHYTMVKTNMFNGVEHPTIAMWTENNTLEIFREFNYNDFKHRLS